MTRIRAILATIVLVAGAALAVVAAPAASTAACAPTNLPNGSSGPIQAAAGGSAFFAVPNLCLTGAAAITIDASPAGTAVVVNGDGTAGAGFTVTPPSTTPTGVAGTVHIVDGAASRDYTFRASFGPTDQVFWGELVPSTLAVQVGVPSYYVFEGMYWPVDSACEINIRNWSSDELDPVLAPANAAGIPVEVGVKGPGGGTDFKGIVTYDYEIVCDPPDGPASSHTFKVTLYVGIPIPVDPVLPATGPSPAPLIAISGAILGLGALLLVLGRRRRHVS